ncbi:energy transducer TonB [Marilutibacter spongiae]|uniref:Energy transducer TonB n=1 Tax=Marilutibacter spongiae TaxID=2025720 RepID=A0A7W3TJD7_9GAMM|nr:energy transducer TonB [Lysobacter spongiae]MBB1059393.1 energy transducer TonB [Lysobacter spongiae]
MNAQSRSSRSLLTGLALASLVMVVALVWISRSGGAGADGTDTADGGETASPQALQAGDAGPETHEAVAGDRRARPVVGTATPPAFPIEAVKRGESGRVVLAVVVDPRGQATAVSIAESSTSTLLDEAAREAVQRWQFEPALEGGKPVADTIEIPVEFEPAG